MLRAQHRGRSVQNDYKEFVGNAMLGQKAMVLELFNLVLGWGPNTDQFWSGKRSCADTYRSSLGCQI